MKNSKRYFGAVLTLLVFLVLGGWGSGNEKSGESTGKIDYPTKSVTLISPTSAGGGTDLTARALATEAEKHLGQSIGIVNKPGGSGSLGMTEGANAKSDGYTVTMVIAELTMLEHLGISPLSYEQVKPVALVNLDPAALTVPADAPYNTLEEFVAYAKENPGKLNIGNAGSGSTWHLAAESLAKNAGIELNHVPFEGAAPSVTALVGGHIDAVTVSPAEVKTQLEAGNVKTLAVMSNNRSEIIPDVPTFSEAGLDIEEIGTWRGLVVPKDTPDEIVTILEDAFLKAAEEESFKEFMESNGLGIELKGSSEFGKYMEENFEYYGKLIPELGLGSK